MSSAGHGNKPMEFLRFLAGGASTTLISYAAYLLFLKFFPYLPAYTAAYLLGITWSYFVNTLFVFRRRPNVKRALAYPLVYVAQYLVSTISLTFLVEYIKADQDLAPLIVIILTLPLTYILSRLIVTARCRIY